MRSTYTLMTAAGLTMAMVAGFAFPAEAACTRLGFTVNDYGKEGPTRDAKSLLDKHIAKKMAERGVSKYNVGKKDVKCELFLDFIVFDEYTCTAEASVCWDESAAKSEPAVKAANSESEATAKEEASESAGSTPEEKSEDTAAAPKVEEPAAEAASSPSASEPASTPSETASEPASAAIEPTSSAPEPDKVEATAPESDAPAAKKSSGPVEIYEKVPDSVSDAP